MAHPADDHAPVGTIKGVHDSVVARTKSVDAPMSCELPGTMWQWRFLKARDFTRDLKAKGLWQCCQLICGRGFKLDGPPHSQGAS